MRIAFIMNDDFYLWHFRKGLLLGVKDAGFEVTAITPHGPYVPMLEGLGIKHIAVPMYRFMSPLKDLRMIRDLYAVLKRERFDIVHTMTIKPNIYGSIASRLAGTRRVVGLVSGLGYTFMPASSAKERALQMATRALYKLGFSFTDKVWFQNGDDLALMVERGLIPEKKTLLIKSGGIDLELYKPCAQEGPRHKALRQTLDLHESGKLFTVIAKMNHTKGIMEFIEAGKQLLKRHPDLRFALVGPIEKNNPQAISEEELTAGLPHQIKWLGFLDSIKEVIYISHAVVLPSYYREGVPRAILEAMAMCKPIVTTDNVGCRETVDHGVNGFLVPVKDAGALADAMERLALDNDLAYRLGQASREKAAREFDERVVIERVIGELYEMPGGVKKPS